MPIQPQKWNSEAVVIGPDADPNDDVPAATGLANGGYAVVWNRVGLGGTLNSIQLRIYDAFGTATTGALQVVNNTASGVFDPDVASFDSSGNIVVAYRLGTGDLYYAVYTSAGAVVLAPTALATGASVETDVSVTRYILNGTETVLAVWEDASAAKDGSGSAIRARYISSSGAFSGAEFTINTQTTGDQVNPDAATGASGTVAVVWTDLNANAGDIKLRTFANTTGGPQISEITVNATTAGLQDNAAAAVLANGNIVVVWESGANLYYRAFSPTGSPLTVETQFAVGSDPQIAAATDGGFTLLYRHASLDGSGGGLRMGAYDPSFNIVSGTSFVTVNTTTANDQEDADIAVLEDGRHVVVFTDESTGTDDNVRLQVMDIRVQTINGTAGADTLVGRTTGMIHADDIISGLDGDDLIYGLSGVDSLFGGAGNDLIDGGAGADQISGGSGDDILYIDNQDTYDGGAGFDRAFWQSATSMTVDMAARAVEFVVGSGVADTIDNSGAGPGFLYYLYGQGGNDSLIGGTGDDVLVGGAGADNMTGGDGNDWLYVDDTDTWSAGAGFDRLFWQSSSALSIDMAAQGVEQVVGSNSADTFDNSAAGPGLYYMYGQGGNDQMLGGAGDDVFYSGSGIDTVTGNAGDDWIHVDNEDTYSGGAGFDRLYWQSATGLTIVMTTLSIEFVVGGDGGDTFDNTGAGPGLYYFYAQGGNDTMLGGAGDDVFFAGLGADNVTGADGNDWIFIDELDTYSGGAGFDRVFWQGAGSANIDMAARGVEFAVGGAAADTINNSGAGAGTYYLYGEGGNDVLRSGGGQDFMFGGTGADTFRFGDNSADSIYDFSRAEGDRIDLTLVTAPHAFANLIFTNNSGGTIITLNSTGTFSVFVPGVDAGTWTAGDFIL